METMTAVLPAPRLQNTTDIRGCLADSSHLLLAGRRKEAADCVWSAFEASVRLSLTELGEQTDDPIRISDSPEGLSSQAVAYGVIDPEDRETLLRFLSQRDTLNGQSKAIDTETLRQIEYITERTLDEMKQQQDHTRRSTAKDNIMTITSNQFISFATGLTGTNVLTATGKPFAVAIKGGNIYVTPQSTKLEQRRFTTNNIQSALSLYSQSGTLRPTDYSTKIAHSSYFVGILKLYLAQAQQASVPNQQ